MNRLGANDLSDSRSAAQQCEDRNQPQDVIARRLIMAKADRLTDTRT
jgi:hypothetical protein